MSGVVECVFATLFPSDCRLCGVPLVKISRLPVCDECVAQMLPIAGGLCSVCGVRLASPFAAGERCGLCRRAGPPFAKAVAYGSYDGRLRELIHLLKYEQVRSATGVLGRMLAEAISGLVTGAEQVMVVPIPLHRRKLRQRGFNQTELIVLDALKRIGGRRYTLLPLILERHRETQSQIGLTRHQRRENMRGAFAVLKPELVKGQEILIVDDVFTTGTTVSECARVLRRSGASKVYVATVARTLKAEARLMGWPQAEERQTMAAAG
jgi:ComF family protein